MRLVVETFSKRLLLSLLLFFSVASAFAQNGNKLMRDGSKYYEKGNHRVAVTFFEKAIAEDPANAQALYLAGISYMSFDKEKSADYIYRAQAIDPDVDVDLLFWLGKAEHINYNFDKAIEHFKNYQKSLPKREKFQYDLASVHIQHARNAKQEIENPKEVFVRNLGPAVNSIYSEHSPAISSDDNYLVFTSRGKSVTGGKESGDGEYFEDIFETTRLGPNDWRAVRSVPGKLNGPGHEACIQLFDNDKKMLLYRSDNDGDIMVAERKGDGTWGSPRSISDKVNSKFYESDAFITPDGKTLFFSTNQYTNGSNLDLYKVELQLNGEWGTAVSLGDVINSAFDEDSPFLAGDGSLYFSSRGHNTMGGYDIFKSTFDETTQQWSKPTNMGVPINSPDDDTYYRLSSDGRYAYLSSYRIGGYGEKDIYTVTFENAAHIAGKVFSKRDSSAIAGVEVRFLAVKSDKQPLKYQKLIKNATDNYELEVMAGITYQVEIVKDNKVLAKQDVKVPASKNITAKLINNFYIDLGDKLKEPEKLVASIAEQPVAAPPVVEEILVQPPVSEIEKSLKTELKKKPVVASVPKVKEVKIAVAPISVIALSPEEPEAVAVAPVVEEEVQVQPPVMELEKSVKSALQKKQPVAALPNKVKEVKVAIAPKPVVALSPEEPEVVAVAPPVVEEEKLVQPPVTELEKSLKTELKRKPVVASIPKVKEVKIAIAPKPVVALSPEEPEVVAVAKATPPAATKPAAQPAPSKQAEPVEDEGNANEVAFESIFYDVGSFTLRPASLETLDKIAKMMIDNKDVKIKVQGYTMVEAVSDYSRNLSRNRARSAYEYLLKKGVPASRMVLSTFNNISPIAANTTEESMQMNRMTRFIMIPKETK